MSFTGLCNSDFEPGPVTCLCAASSYRFYVCHGSGVDTLDLSCRQLSRCTDERVFSVDVSSGVAISVVSASGAPR